MKVPQDERFRQERARYRLRFTCEDCVLFDAAGPRCAHGYPIERHRHERYEDPEADLLFCKEFDLA